MITVRLLSRESCHLCEKARADLESLKQEIPHRLEVVDIDNDPKLQREYGVEVPVVLVGPYRLRTPFSIQELRMTLAAAQDRERHIEMVERSPALAEVRRRGVWTKSDSFTYWISKHYMAVFNLFVIAYLGMAFLAPVLMKVGARTPADLIYRGYSLVCHQLAYRSFFVFGEQLVYPRESAGVEGVRTLNQVTGIGESSSASDLFAARTYLGNEHAGYKVALCQRDVAIYGGILFFGLLFVVFGKRLPPAPWYLWIFFGIIPIAVDGLSQLLSQPPLNFWVFRESTPTFRVLTGFLFGSFTAWLGYPLVEEAMQETRQMMESKQERAFNTKNGGLKEYSVSTVMDPSPRHAGDEKQRQSDP